MLTAALLLGLPNQRRPIAHSYSFHLFRPRHSPFLIPSLQAPLYSTGALPDEMVVDLKIQGILARTGNEYRRKVEHYPELLKSAGRT